MQAQRKIESPTLLDMAVVLELKSYPGKDGKTLFSQLADLFSQDTVGRLKSLESAITKKDFVSTRKEAHGLKSSCATIGATQMLELCVLLESGDDEFMNKEATATFRALKDSFTQTSLLVRQAAD